VYGICTPYRRPDPSSQQTFSVRAVADLEALDPPAREGDDQDHEGRSPATATHAGVGSGTTVNRPEKPSTGSSTGKSGFRYEVTLKRLSHTGRMPLMPSHRSTTTAGTMGLRNTRLRARNTAP
jgi:hypothetical protein